MDLKVLGGLFWIGHVEKDLLRREHLNWDLNHKKSQPWDDLGKHFLGEEKSKFKAPRMEQSLVVGGMERRSFYLLDTEEADR